MERLDVIPLFPHPKEEKKTYGYTYCYSYMLTLFDILLFLLPTIYIFQEAGPDGGKIQMHFEELLKSNTAIYVVILTVSAHLILHPSMIS